MNAGQDAALVKIMLVFVDETDLSAVRVCRAYITSICSRLKTTKGAGIRCLICSIIHRNRESLDCGFSVKPSQSMTSHGNASGRLFTAGPVKASLDLYQAKEDPFSFRARGS